MLEKVSIIVPVFNCETEIAEMVNSVLCQSYSEWELILVDDGSTDQSAQRCETYAANDDRITLYRKKNGGVSSARNFGLSHAQGKYVMFLDADDMWMPDTLKTMVGYADDVDLVVCGIQRTDGKKQSVADEVTCYNNVSDTSDQIETLYFGSFYNSPCNKLYLREKITARFDEQLSTGEDWLFNLCYFEKCGRIRAIPQLLYIYRVGNSTTLSNRFFSNADLFLSYMFDRLISVVGDKKEVRNLASFVLIESLLSHTTRLMKSDVSFKEKYAVIKKWSKNSVLKDKRINKQAFKNKNHRIVFALYRTHMVLLIMLLCGNYKKYTAFVSKSRNATAYFLALLKTATAYLPGRLLYARKRIWLIGERPWQAQDNGYHFFKYLNENHPERKNYYVITKDSPQLKKVEEVGNVVYFGSWKYWMMYFGCETVISAHNRKILPSKNWRYQKLASHFKQKNKKLVFLQHGIIYSDSKSLYKENAHLDLFICSAKAERELIINRFHYTENEVKCTGLARFDALYDFTIKKQILIMPTWRSWLSSPECDLKSSDYFQTWNSVISNSALIHAAKEAGYQIIFYPHSNLQFARDLFVSIDDTVVIADEVTYDVQTLLKESALLITDYSSVFFDFAYMKKPMLYYQFDNEHYVQEHYQKGYFEFERDGFGKVAYSEPELVENVLEVIADGFALKEEYGRRIDQFFVFHDQNNCERIYNEIERLCSAK